MWKQPQITYANSVDSRIEELSKFTGKSVESIRGIFKKYADSLYEELSNSKLSKVADALGITTNFLNTDMNGVSENIQFYHYFVDRLYYLIKNNKVEIEYDDYDKYKDIIQKYHKSIAIPTTPLYDTVPIPKSVVFCISNRGQEVFCNVGIVSGIKRVDIYRILDYSSFKEVSIITGNLCSTNDLYDYLMSKIPISEMDIVSMQKSFNDFLKGGSNGYC